MNLTSMNERIHSNILPWNAFPFVIQLSASPFQLRRLNVSKALFQVAKG